MSASVVELARRATKSDWLVRDSFIKMLSNVVETVGLAAAHQFAVEFIGKLYQDAMHTLAVYDVKQELEKMGAKCTVVFLGNKIGDLIAASEKNVYFVEVKAHKPPWGGGNPQELEEYRAHPGRIIYVWRAGPTWVYASLEEIRVRDGMVAPQAQHSLSELDL